MLFCLIPKDLALRKKNGWIWHAEKINPTSDHCFCSEHFFGGKKTFENNIPTKVPKMVNPKVFKERKSRNSWYLYKSFQEFPYRCWKWTWTFRDNILNSIKNEITRKSMNYQKRSWEQRLKLKLKDLKLMKCSMILFIRVLWQILIAPKSRANLVGQDYYNPKRSYLLR